MTTPYARSEEVAEIRGRIDHPIIDGDGHIIEYLPLVRDILVEVGGSSVAERFDLVVDSGRLTQMLSPAQRREMALMRMPWWGIPTRNTLDRATAMLPKLLYERLDQIGIDVAIAYPTYGLTAIHLTDDELRPALSRAFNVYVAEVYAPYRDRILPVACIPTFTPEEGDRRARVRGRGARPARGHDGRRDPAALPRHRYAGRAVDRRPRSRLDPRLHAAVGEVRRARRLADVPLDGRRLGRAHVADQLRVQPHRELRGGGRAHRAVAVLRRRAHAVPAAAVRVPRRRRRAGRATCSATFSATGRSATATRSGSTTRPRSTGRSSMPSSRSTPKVGCAIGSTGSPTASTCCRSRSWVTT